MLFGICGILLKNIFEAYLRGWLEDVTAKKRRENEDILIILIYNRKGFVVDMHIVSHQWQLLLLLVAANVGSPELLS